MSDSPRQRMIESAVLLMREHGVEGTSFSQVLEHSGAPRGSIYHHFPRGKTQLIEEATRAAGDLIATGMARSLERGDPLSLLDAWAEFWRMTLEGSDFAAGCPIVSSSLEGERTPTVRDAAGQVFQDWQEVVAEGLVRHGVEPARAASLATMSCSAIEGSVILSRAQRSMEPLERTIAELRTLIADALPTPAAS